MWALSGEPVASAEIAPENARQGNEVKSALLALELICSLAFDGPPGKCSVPRINYINFTGLALVFSSRTDSRAVRQSS